MINVKNNIKKVISDIYECQKQILINRRLTRELELNVNTNNAIRLNHELNILKRKIMQS